MKSTKLWQKSVLNVDHSLKPSSARLHFSQGKIFDASFESDLEIEAYNLSLITFGTYWTFWTNCVFFFFRLHQGFLTFCVALWYPPKVKIYSIVIMKVLLGLVLSLLLNVTMGLSRSEAKKKRINGQYHLKNEN